MMHANLTLRAIFLLILPILSVQLSGQCKIDNKYFQAGEHLEYDLFFKIGFLNTHAGNASLSISEINHDGQNVLKTAMVSETVGAAHRFFPLSDTVQSYMTKDLVPLAFFKNAHEGKDFTEEKVKYKYENGKITVNTFREKNGNFKFDETVESKNCIYDLMSVVYLSRTLDYETMKTGDSKLVEFVTGKRHISMVIEHKGFENIKANNKQKYKCIKLVLSLTNANEKAFEDKEEAMKVYISNDKNRIPVKMEFKLKVGATKGYLRSATGLRN